MTDHCVLDYSSQPPQFRCKWCGGFEPISLPMAVTELVRRSDVFTAMHQHCWRWEAA